MNDESERSDDGAVVPGERREALVGRRDASLQSKVQNALALGVVMLLGGGFLAWYYLGLAERRADAATPVKRAAPGEMKLPPLGPAPQRRTPVVASVTPVEAGSAEERALLQPDPTLLDAPAASADLVAVAPSPPDPTLQRRLEAPVLVHVTGRGPGPRSIEPSSGADALAAERGLDGQGRPESGLARAGQSDAALDERLQPTVLAASAAGVVPDRRFLLAKGAFVDCTLETAIDSTLPGMTTCVVATDVWSADGTTVLMERGTRLVGETRGGVQQGQRRVFVLWTEARTPAGVVVALASPGTDALGRSGLAGEVDSHFGARFGAAILISLVDAGAAALVAAQHSGGDSVIVSSSGAHDVVSEVLRHSLGIAPTIAVAPGTRLQVLVARDVNFEPVYSLARR